MTGVRSGCGRASRSMRTKDHICQQFAVEFRRVSVNTCALVGEASIDASLLAGSKTIPEWWNIEGPFGHQKMFNCTLYLRQTDNRVVHRRP